NCCPGASTLQVGLQPPTLAMDDVIIGRLSNSFAANATASRGSTDLGRWKPPVMYIRAVWDADSSMPPWRSGHPSPMRSLAARNRATHQALNFASADAYVAEHAVVEARELRSSATSAQLSPG